MNEYSIILLSNSSTEFYNNKLSEFTNRLNPPLNLSPLGKWKVGLTEIRHNNLLDYIYATTEKDKIIFDDWFSKQNKRDISVRKFANMLWYSAENPVIYNNTYFQDFLDPKKLENFPDETCFKQYQMSEEEEEESKLFNVTISLESNPQIGERKISFRTSYQYTAKQIFYKIVQVCFEMLSSIDNLIFQTNFIVSKGHALNMIVTSFIDQIRFGTQAMRKNRINHFDSLGSFVYIYSDIIGNSHIGDKYHKILSLIPVKEMESEYTSIRNVHYVPVNVENVNQISIKLADENSNPLPLEGGFNPTMIKLHFKKDI